MKISLLLVVVLLNLNVYSQTYERFKVVQVWSIHFRVPIWFWNFWVQFLSDYPLLHLYGKPWYDYTSFHGSVAQFQYVLAEICVIEICLVSSRYSFQDNNLILQCLRSILINYHVLHIAGKIFWLCFFWWWSCRIPVCIGIDMCIWRLPKFQTLILRHQTCFSGCELSACPIALFWVFLKSYFECVSFGGCVAHVSVYWQRCMHLNAAQVPDIESNFKTTNLFCTLWGQF